MRSTFSARIRRIMSVMLTALLAFTLAPTISLADEDPVTTSDDEGAPLPLAKEFVTSRTVLIPASTLSSSVAATITSGTVELSDAKVSRAEQSAIPTLMTTYVAQGCVYTFDEAASTFTLVNAVNADLAEDDCLIVPSSLLLDGATYPVTSIAPGAFSNVDAAVIALSANMASIDAEAAIGNDTLQALYVSPYNEVYASSDGCLYDKPLNSLLLVPGGRTGTVRVTRNAEADDAEVFSHYSSAALASAEADGAVFSSRNMFMPEIDDAVDAIDRSGEIAVAPDGATIVVDEEAFAPIAIVIPERTPYPELPNLFSEEVALSEPTTDEAVFVTEGGEEPVVEEDLITIETASVFDSSLSLPNYEITFDRNGSDEYPVTSWPALTSVMTSGVQMPALNVTNMPQRQGGFVFMGLYDGSDWQTATRYYDAAFQQSAGCKTTYDFTAQGLRLYAGWAPVLKVDVPSSVAIALYTMTEMDAPQGSIAAIKNFSPWEVVCTSLEWDTTKIEGAIDEASVANRIERTTPAQMITAGSSEGRTISASTQEELEDIFGQGYREKVKLRISDADDDTASVALPPDVVAVAGTNNADLGFLTVSPAPALNEATEKPLYYTIDLGGSPVSVGDAINNTVLVSTFEVSSAPVTPARSMVLFDQNGADENGPAPMPLEATQGVQLDDLLNFLPPMRAGYTFMGYFDDPYYDRTLADGSKPHRYYDANGSAIDRTGVASVWDKATATTLYAGWQANDAEVRFWGNGGQIYNADNQLVPMRSYPAHYGDTLSDVLGGALPSARFQQGATIVNTRLWASSAVGGNPLKEDALATTLVSAENGLDYYAQWAVPAAPIALTLEANGGSFLNSEGQAESLKSLATDRANLLSVLADVQNLPTNPGFVFRGWSRDSAAGSAILTEVPPLVGDLTLYAQWESGSYEIVWDMGTDRNEPALVRSFTYDPRATLLNLYPGANVIARLEGRGPGFHFLGFYATDENGHKVGERIGANTALPQHDMRYTAFWTIDITFNAGEGVLADGSHELTDASHLSGGVLNPPVPPTREGYSFEGWFTTANDGGDLVETGATVLAPQILHAHWSRAYTVTFDGNGENDVAGIPDSFAIDHGTTKPLPMSVPVRAGYTFKGWSLDRAPSEATWQPGDEYAQIRKADVTLYAVWDIAVYAISYDLDGGYAIGNPVVYTVRTETFSLNAPEKEGYTFQGWTGIGLADLSKDVTVPKGSTGNRSYKAHWAMLPRVVTLQWNSAGGSSIAATTQLSESGATVVLPTDEPVRVGYEFLGWYTAMSDGEKVTELTSLPEANTIYYAQWKGNPIKLNWVSAGGTTIEPTEQEFSDHGTLELPGEPVKPGYKFEGWFTKPAGTPGEEKVTNTTPLPSVETTYYAYWSAKMITVRWSAQGGTPNEMTAREEYSPIKKLVIPTEPALIGHTFEGWWTQASGGERVADDAALPSSDTTYYAHWAAKTSKLVFDGNGGQGIFPSGLAATYGAALPPITATPTRSGYRFLGYYSDPNTGVQYYDANLSRMRTWEVDTTEESKLYAQWATDFLPAAEVPIGEEGKFYIELDAAKAREVSTAQLTVQPGFYGATPIKQAALDIAANREQSVYYSMFKTIMDKDYKFITTWWDAANGNNSNEVSATDADTYTVRIIGLCQDYTTKTKDAYAGITFQFADKVLSSSYRINNEETNAAGWERSELRARMNPSHTATVPEELPYGDEEARQSIWKRAPSAIRNNVRPVWKFTNDDETIGSSSTVNAVKDMMFIASYAEMVKAENYFSNAIAKAPWMQEEGVRGTVYQYWASKNIAGAADNSSLVKLVKSTEVPDWSPGSWWERTRPYQSVTNYYHVIGTGSPSANYRAHTHRGVAPCFCF